MNIVVAACKNKGIGINNKLPWNLSKDLKFFRFLTQSYGENAIVMGKNTCLSLPRALPKRVNYVLSSSLKNDNNGFNIIEDISLLKKKHYDNIWLIGGAKVYESLINNNMINSIYYTDIDAEYDCDTFFPEIPSNFKNAFESKSFIDNDINFNIKVYVKDGLESIDYINKATIALHYAHTTLGKS